MNQQEYQQIYEQTLRSGTRKLKWMDFFGIGYHKFNAKCDELKHNLFEIDLAARQNNTLVLSTEKMLDLGVALLRVEVNRDTRIRWN